MIMSFLWAIPAAAIAVLMEWWYRSHHTFPWWALVLQPVLGYCIFRVLDRAPSLLSGIAIFGFIVLATRVGVSHFVLHERVSGVNAVRAVLLLVAGVVR